MHLQDATCVTRGEQLSDQHQCASLACPLLVPTSLPSFELSGCDCTSLDPACVGVALRLSASHHMMLRLYTRVEQECVHGLHRSSYITEHTPGMLSRSSDTSLISVALTSCRPSRRLAGDVPSAPCNKHSPQHQPHNDIAGRTSC